METTSFGHLSHRLKKTNVFDTNVSLAYDFLDNLQHVGFCASDRLSLDDTVDTEAKRPMHTVVQ